MKRYVYPLMLLLLMSCGQKSQKIQEEDKMDAPLAEIEFPEGTVHDFGVYHEKDTVTCNFLVHNPGKVPLVINQLETSCGCTEAFGPKKPILEGQTDTIHVTYDGNGFYDGFWIKNVVVHANVEKGTRVLTIHGSYYGNESE